MWIVTDNDDDECEKWGDDFGSKRGKKCDFSHEQACSITKSVVLSRMCGTPVVTTRAGTKGADSTKRWVVATLFSGDRCVGSLPVRVVLEERVSVGSFNLFECLSKVTSEPLGWSWDTVEDFVVIVWGEFQVFDQSVGKVGSDGHAATSSCLGRVSNSVDDALRR